MRRKGVACNTGESVTAATDSSLADNEWLIINDDVAQHPPYRHLDSDDSVSGVNNILVAYLLLLGHVTAVVVAVRLIVH